MQTTGAVASQTHEFELVTARYHCRVLSYYQGKLIDHLCLHQLNCTLAHIAAPWYHPPSCSFFIVIVIIIGRGLLSSPSDRREILSIVIGQSAAFTSFPSFKFL